MGLDVTGFKKLIPVIEGDVEVIKFNREERAEVGRSLTTITQHLIDYTETNFPGRTAGLKPGIYRFEDWISFKAGSYTGFNDWRDTLSLFSHRKTARDIWLLKPEVQSGPFIELINFSDCEGVIGPEVSAKLANDFAVKARFMRDCAARHSNGESFMENYRRFAKAFTFAADSGFVKFH